MLKILENFLTTAMLLLLFWPSFWGFGVAFLRLRNRTVDPTNSRFNLGIGIHTFNTMLSPCIPAYLAYQDAKIGGGSVGSLLSLLILPMTWILFWQGNRQISKAAESAKDHGSNAQLLEAVREQAAQAVIDFKVGGSSVRDCPACGASIYVELLPNSPAHVATRCSCGLSAGQYQLERVDQSVQTMTPIKEI